MNEEGFDEILNIQSKNNKEINHFEDRLEDYYRKFQ
jgi:hypothetical protein